MGQGQSMNFSTNSRYRNRLLVSTAMAGATILGFGQSAEAACTTGAPPAYVCSGANTTGQIVPAGIGLPLDAGDFLLLALAPANPTVTTDPGFSVSTSDPFALGILGKGAVSYTDANSSALSSTTGIGLGVVSLVPQIAPPYYGPNPGGSVAIDTGGAISGALIGLAAINTGDGTTSVKATGDIAATGGYGAVVYSQGSDSDVHLGKVTGTEGGIQALNQSVTANLKITADGDVDGGTGTGIYARNGGQQLDILDTILNGTLTFSGPEVVAGKDLTVIANGKVTGSLYGIVTSNRGTGATTITAKGEVNGVYGGIAAFNNNSAGSDLIVDAMAVNGRDYGIYARNAGAGEARITAKDKVTASNGTGIYADNADWTAGDLIVDAMAVSGSIYGVQTVNRGTGVTSIATTGTVQGGSAAIKAESNAGQAITIITSGLVRNNSGLTTDLAVETSGGPVNFTSNWVLAGTLKLGAAAGNIVNNNATWYTAGGTSEFGGGTLINSAGERISAANLDATAPVTTTFNGLATFTNNGRLTMANDVAGDVIRQIGGNTTFASGSIYAIDVDGAGHSDLFTITGTADLSGAALVVNAQGLAVGTYTVLTADGGLGGTEFASVIGVTSTAFLSVADGYDANNAYLDVTKVADFADAGLTPNQIATGEGLDSLTSGPLFNAVASLATDAEARAAFDQLSGEIHASAKGMLVEDSRFVRDAATSRIRAAFGDGGTTAAIPVMAYGEGGPEMVAADTDRFAVWGQAFGSWGNTDSDGNAAAFDRSTGGLLAGADTLVGGWRVGLLGGYSHSNFDADDRSSSGDADNYHLGLYGGTNWGAIAFRTGAAYSWSSLSTKRSVAFNDLANQLSADYDAGTAQIFGELAYKADAGQFKFEPFANLAYVSVHTDGFSETGGDAALTSAGTTTDTTFTTLGLRGSSDFALGGMTATARGMLGWRHAFGDTTPLSTFAFAGGEAFSIAGVPIARDSAVVEAGLDLKMSANATLGLSYSGHFGDGSVDNGAKVDLAVKF